MCREQSVVPLEKRKKGKRKSDALQEAAESDDTASLCTLATGGEESTDPMDNTVSAPPFLLYFIPAIHSVHGFHLMRFYLLDIND